MKNFGEYYENPEPEEVEQADEVKPPEQKIDFKEAESELFAEALKNHELGEKESKLVAQFISGILNPKEEVKFKAARNLWWAEKFGFPYNNQPLRELLLTAIEKYSYDKKIADVLAKSVDFFENQKTLNSLIKQNKGNWNDEMREIVLKITEFRANICEIFEKKHLQNDEQCQDFWQIISDLAAASGNVNQIENLKKSTLSQVAVFLGLKEIGLTPTQVDAEVDAFQMIDLRTGNDVFQIKTGKKIPRIIIEPSNNIAANGVVFTKNGVNIINVDGEKFTIKVEKYEESLARKNKNQPRQKINGYVIAIPDDKYDFTTGKPSKELVEALREKFGDNQ